jgi:hypothetical protein
LKAALSALGIMRSNQNQPIFKRDEAFDLFFNLNRDHTPHAKPKQFAPARCLSASFDCVDVHVIHFGSVRQFANLSSGHDGIDGP